MRKGPRGPVRSREVRQAPGCRGCLRDPASTRTADARAKPSTTSPRIELDRRAMVGTLLEPPTRKEFWGTLRIMLARQIREPRRDTKPLYFLCYERVLLADRELRLPDRVLRRGAWDHGHSLPERGHTPRFGRAGPAGTPRSQGRHSLRRPRGHRGQPDRLLGGLPGGTALRLEVGAPREAHPRAPGMGRTALRASRRQGRLRWPLLLGLACSRSTGGWHEPHALEHVRRLQCSGRDGVGYGGGPCRVLLRPELGRDAALVGTLSVIASLSTPGGARRLLRLPVGDFPQEPVVRARSARRLLQGKG